MMLAAADARDAVRPLDDVDWTFSSSLSAHRRRLPLVDLRRHHWYPATFIPEVPFTLIEVLTRPGDCVFDPFSGIGTTLWQAVALNRRAIGVEALTVPTELMESFAALFDASTDTADLLGLARQTARGFLPHIDYARPFASSTAGSDLARWYAPSVYQQICYLRSRYERARDAELVQEAALINLLSDALLKPMCEQRRGWGCIADNMRPKAIDADTNRDVLGRFVRRASLLAKDLRRLRALVPAHERDGLVETGKLSIVHGDASDFGTPFPSAVDLVVTSPPYPGMTDYATSQRLSYYWRGLDPMDELPLEIGARRKRFSSRWLTDYSTEVDGVMKRVAACVRPGGMVALVLPQFSSTTRGGVVRSHAATAAVDSLEAAGLELSWQGDRFLPTARRHQNQRWTHLQRERIVILRVPTMSSSEAR